MSHKNPLIAAWIIVALVLNASPAAFVLPLQIAFAQTAAHIWNGSVSDDWYDTQNWTPASVPTDGEVTIPSETPYAPNLTGNLTFEGFTVAADASIYINGSLTVTSGGISNGNIVLFGTLTIPIEGTFTNGGQIDLVGTLANSGNFINNGIIDHTYGGTITGTITNNGTIACPDGGEWDGAECVAVVRTWTGASGENWADPDNWEEGAVPTNGQEVIIPGAAFVYPILNTSFTAGSLHLLGDATLTIDTAGSLSIGAGEEELTGILINNGILNITNGFENTSEIVNGATGIMTVNESSTFTSNGNLSNYGEFVIQAGAVASFDSGSIENFDGGQFENFGDMYMSGVVTFLNDSGGTVTSTGETGVLFIWGAAVVFTNNGLLHTADSANITNLGTVTNGSTGTFQHDLGTQLTNQGTFSVALGTFTSGGNILNLGTFICPTGSYLTSNACAIISAYHWKGTTNSIWTTATNWLEGSAPPNGSAVVIDNNATRTAVLSTSSTLASISVFPNKSLTVASAGTLAVTGPITMCGTLLVQGTMTTNGAVANKGTMKISPTGTLNVNNTLTVDAGKTLTESGTLIFGASSTFTNNGTLTNFGSTTFPSGSTITNNGTFNFASGTLSNGTTVTNNGTISCASGKSWNGSACALPISSSSVSSESSSSTAPSGGGGGSRGVDSNTSPTTYGTSSAQNSASSASNNGNEDEPTDNHPSATNETNSIVLTSGLSFDVPAEPMASIDASEFSAALKALTGKPSVFLSGSAPVTRGDAIAAILKQFNIPILKNEEQIFSDIRRNDPNADAIATAAKLGLITGYENLDGSPTGKFGPKNKLKSYELKILVRRLERLPEFTK